MSFCRTALLAAAATTLLATALPAAAQFQRPDDAVKYRKSAFSVMGAHVGRIGAMVNGRVPFDGAAASANADVIAFVSRLPYQGFVEGTSSTEKGGARPASGPSAPSSTPAPRRCRTKPPNWPLPPRQTTSIN